MKNYIHKRSDGSVVVTRFHNNTSYSKEYASMQEYNKSIMDGGISIWKFLLAPIYYPIMFLFKICYLTLKGFYWDLPRFIYGKIKK